MRLLYLEIYIIIMTKHMKHDEGIHPAMEPFDN